MAEGQARDVTRHLLVGIGDVDAMIAPRHSLVRLVDGLRDLGVSTQVGVFGDGPVADALGEVADVYPLTDVRADTPARKLTSAARMVSPHLADQVQAHRTRDGRLALRQPDCIHLQGVRGAAVLHHVPDSDAPVTVYVHPGDYSIAGLAPRDRRRLVERVDRFLTAEDSVIEPLLAAGVDPGRIEPVGDLASLLPDVAPRADVDLARSVLDLADEGLLVALPPAADWAGMPDLTVRLAWELERAGGGPNATVLWHGMPGDGVERWPIDEDLRRAGVTSIRMLSRSLDWAETVELADVVVLPTRGAPDLPAGAAELAALHTTPLLCWADHPLADEVARWAGTVVPRGDLAAMAAAIHRVVVDDDAVARARAAIWATRVGDLERLLPLGIPVP